MEITPFGPSQSYDIPREVWRPSPITRDAGDVPRDPQVGAHVRSDNGYAPYSDTYNTLHPSHHQEYSYRSLHDIKNEGENQQSMLSSGLLALRYDSEHTTANPLHHPSINDHDASVTHPDSASSSPCPAPDTTIQSGGYTSMQSSYGSHPAALHLQDYVRNSASSCGLHQEYNAQYTLPMHPVTSHFSDNHVTTNISPNHAGIFPSMNVNVSMNMNVHGVPSVVPPGYYEPHSDPWSSRIGHQSSFYPSPVTGSEYLSHGSHGAYGSYTPMHHSYNPMYESDTRLSATLERDSYYKSVTSDSVSRLYSLGALNQRRPSGRLSSPFDVPGKVNLCRVCGKTYARPSTLKTHMRTHSGEKPYKCTTCSKSFSQAANLTAHLRTHSGEKPFRCPLCERRFSQSSSVTTHLRTHSGERPYRCRLCKKAFSDSSTLTKHLRIHSGEKPYQCKLCLLRFSQSGNLNRHMRVHAANGI